MPQVTVDNFTPAITKSDFPGLGPRHRRRRPGLDEGSWRAGVLANDLTSPPRRLNSSNPKLIALRKRGTVSNPISITVPTGVAISAKSTSTRPGDHVAVFNLAVDGGTNNAGLNVVSANAAFTACEVTGREKAHGTLKISHLNPGPDVTSDENAAAISIDLQAGGTDGTSAQGIFLKSTTGGTSGKIMNYVDQDGVTIFALLPDGSLLLRALDATPAGTDGGLKLCNVAGQFGVVDATGTFTPLT
jgi:Hyaluronidase protein (HylP)